MAPRRVIADSDDDGSSTENSPEKLHLAPQSGPIDFDASAGLHSLQNGSGSTDPIFFQTVYDEHLATDNRLPENEPYPPMLEDPLMNLPMSSSPAGTRGLKRNKTMNASPVTSLTERVASSSKARRSRSLKDVENLTQITTPRKSTEVTEKDPWEFPGSSKSDIQIDSAFKFISRNASLKTYGKTVRRSKTIDVRSSISEEQRSPHQLQAVPFGPSTDLEKESRNGRLKRSIGPQDDYGDMPPTLPKLKRQKRRASVNGQVLDAGAPMDFQDVSQDIDTDCNNLRSTSTTIQVPRSTSENAQQSTIIQTNASSVRAIGIPLTGEEPDFGMNIAHDTSSGVTEYNQLTASVAVIPNTLTSSQKLQYEIISPSMTSSRRSSLPEMMDVVDHNLKLTGSSTIPNETPIGRVSSISVLTATSPAVLTSVSQTSGIGVKAQRSTLLSLQSPSSPARSTASGNSKKIKRSKTMGHDQEGVILQSSLDELSFDPSITSTNVRSEAPRVKQGKKSTKRTVEEHKVEFDEIFGSDDTGLPRELYQPRPSIRRSKSMSVDPIAQLDQHLQGKRAAKRRPSKRTKSMGPQTVHESEHEPSKSKIAHIKSPRSKSLAVQSPDVIFNVDRNVGHRAVSSTASNDRKSQEITELQGQATELGLIADSANIENQEMHILDGVVPSENAVSDEFSGYIRNHELVAGDLRPTQSATNQAPKRGRPKRVVGSCSDLNNAVRLKTVGANSHTADKGLQASDSDTNTVAAHVEDEEELMSLIPTEPAPVRRRGRPRKTADKQVDILTDLELKETNVSLPVVTTIFKPNAAALHEAEADPNKNFKASQTQEGRSISTPSWAKSSEFLPEKITPPKTSNNTAELVETPKKELKKGSDQHSPLQSGKVPYRVGLSKRTRIAPLLKMIRK